MGKAALHTGAVAKILGIPSRTVTLLAKKGILPTFERWGEGHYRYPANRIMELKERWSQGPEIAKEPIKTRTFQHQLIGEAEKHQSQQLDMVFFLRQQKHTATVLNLLDTYTSQLRESYEPEHFVTPLDKEALSQKEFERWYYARKVFPSLETLIDSQIDSESLAITTKLESEPSYAALEAHYKSSKLWKDIEGYKKLRGQYWSIGFKFHRTILKLLSGPFAEETNARIFRDAVGELLKEKLAPIRVKLQLEGILTDESAVLERLPDSDSTSLRQGAKLLERYLGGELTNSLGESKLLTKLVELLDSLGETYETLKRLEHNISKAVREETLRDTLPGGTTCKFCPIV